MRVKALTTFGGQYAMFKGSVADIPEGPVADILIAGRYIVPVAGDEAVEDEPLADEDVIAEDAAEDISASFKLINIDKMTKKELIEFAEKRNIKVDPKARKADILSAVKSGLGVAEEE